MPDTEVKIASIGECMIELRHSGDANLSLSFGGDTLNTAVYLARCARQTSDEVRIEYVTALGSDRYSDMLRSRWNGEGVGTSLTFTVADRKPGLYLVHVDEQGERSFTYYRSESACRQLLLREDMIAEVTALTSYDYVYLSGITLAILAETARQHLWRVLDELRANGGRVVFDTNYRPALWSSAEVARETITAMSRRVDLALPTFADESLLFGDQRPEATAERLHRAGVPEIAVKLGPDGAFVSSADGAAVVDTPGPVAVVDSTAAGDAFNAAYLHARIHGRTPTEATRDGHRLAAAVLGHPGAVIPQEAMPRLAEHSTSSA